MTERELGGTNLGIFLKTGLLQGSWPGDNLESWGGKGRFLFP